MQWMASWALVLMAALLVSGSSGMVLCFGGNGHLAVEPENHGHCGHAHTAADQEHDGDALSDSSSPACEAGGCVDVPLGSDMMSHATKSLTQDRLQKISAWQLFPVVYNSFRQTVEDVYRRPVYVATSFLAQSLLEKRTIVLLI